MGSGTSASNTSSAMTIRRDGSSSAAQHESNVVLPEPGAPAMTMESRRGRSAQETGGPLIERAAPDELIERAVRDAGELADVDEQVTVASDVTVHDVQARAVVELGVL